MADAISIQELIDARTDAKTLEEAVNGDAVTTVLSRLGETYPTLSNAINQIDSKLDSADAQVKQGITDLFQNGGLPATPFATKALMTASALIDGDYAMVTDDTANNGLYVKTAGVWVKSGYDPSYLAESRFKELNKYNLSVYASEEVLIKASPKSSSQFATTSKMDKVYYYSDYDINEQAETKELVASITPTPSENSTKLYNKIISDLKVLGIWDKLEGLWFGRNATGGASRINWVTPSNLLGLTGSSPFGGGVPSSSSWIFSSPGAFFDTGISVDGSGSLKEDNISVGAIIQRSITTANILGNSTGIGGISLEFSGTTNDGFVAKINNSEPVVASRNSGSGWFTNVTAVRDGNEISLYQDGQLLESAQVNDATISAQTLKIGTSTNEAIDREFNRHIYCVYVGASLTSEDVRHLDRLLMSYIDNYARNNELKGSWVTLGGYDNSGMSSLEGYIFNGEKELVATKNLSGTINESVINQEYKGGYIEIQPDSYNGGSVPATDATTETWGFPYSLKQSEQARLKKEFFAGDGKGIQYIRLPLGFAYRGYRNVDPVSGLARNIGERFKGQNASLKKLFADIAKSGGGLAPEYWCPPVHWLTSGKYNGGNSITAGGSYARSVTLDNIRLSDPTQYAAQIDAFTDAILDDYEYLHTNIAPVRMYGLSNEPNYATAEYGACYFSPDVYSDVLLALHPKVMASEILSEWEGEDNKVLLHVASDPSAPNYWARAEKLIATHPEWIWAYSFHAIERFNGEVGGAESVFAADFFRSADLAPHLATYDHVFSNEFEYFDADRYSDEFKCANNMLYYINSVIYANSELIMPIIHVCKQIGQTSLSTNTSGYALTACNLQEGYGLAPSDPLNTEAAAYGTWSPIAHNFNSWKFISDNLPIGAVRIGGTPLSNLNRCNYVAYKFEGKLLVFIANSSAEAVKVSLTFDGNKQLFGKQYSIKENGATLKPKNGVIIDFVVPAYSGQFWSQ